MAVVVSGECPKSAVSSRPPDGYASTSICAVEHMRAMSDIRLPMVRFRTHIRSDNSRERTEQLLRD